MVGKGEDWTNELLQRCDERDASVWQGARTVLEQEERFKAVAESGQIIGRYKDRGCYDNQIPGPYQPISFGAVDEDRCAVGDCIIVVPGDWVSNGIGRRDVAKMDERIARSGVNGAYLGRVSTSVPHTIKSVVIGMKVASIVGDAVVAAVWKSSKVDGKVLKIGIAAAARVDGQIAECTSSELRGRRIRAWVGHGEVERCIQAGVGSSVTQLRDPQ